jgi:threonine dehydrogenase-like Zn-dependent dehydrogenase
VDATTARPQWLIGIGGRYVDGRDMTAQQVKEKNRPMDLILDASGIPSLEFNLLDALAVNGAYVLTGIPGGDRPIQIPGAQLVRQLVLENQVMLGSVNAARGHFQMGTNDLAHAHSRWGTHLDGLISEHFSPEQFVSLADHHEPNSIKQVVEWSVADQV